MRLSLKERRRSSKIFDKIQIDSTVTPDQNGHDEEFLTKHVGVFSTHDSDIRDTI